MRKLLIHIPLALIFIICFVWCSDNPTQPGGGDPPPNAALYYPGAVGSDFVFSIDTMNNTGNYDSVGVRTSSFNRLETINSTEYVVQINLSNIGGLRDTNELRLRSTVNGIYFYIDTTGFSEYDSLVQAYNLTLKPDEEFKAFFSQSLNSGLWTAFIFNVDVPQYGQQTIIKITAFYEGEEQITIRPISESITSKKINYKMTVLMPDSTFTQIDQLTFESAAWFAENIGLVQLSGNGLLINTLTSGRINFADSNKTIRQKIQAYDIK